MERDQQLLIILYHNFFCLYSTNSSNVPMSSLLVQKSVSHTYVCGGGGRLIGAIKVVGLSREKKEIERKPSTDFEILLMTDG